MKPANQRSTKQTDIPLPSLPPQLDPNRLIRLKEVLRIVPVSASTWWNWVATSRAPAPVRLGNRCTCWRYSDVIALATGEEV
jgi:prophage regulatory protein